MESNKFRGKQLEASRTDEPKPISKGLVRHVWTRNASDRIALDKFTRQLDRDKTAEELHFGQQKQKLLLRKFESQKKERSSYDICDETRRRSSNLEITPGKSPNRTRSYSQPEKADPSSLRLRGLKLGLHGQHREASGGKEAEDWNMISRDTIGSATKHATTKTEHTNNADVAKSAVRYLTSVCSTTNTSVWYGRAIRAEEEDP